MIDPSTLLRLEALVPSRWQTGQQRLVRLRLHNPTEADLRSVRIRAVWPALEGGESPEQVLVSLKRGTTVLLDLALSPARPGEDVFQLQMSTEVGPHLRINLFSQTLTLTTKSPLTGDPNIHINVKDMSIGDKAGFGALVEAGGVSHVGPQIHVRGGGDHFRIAEWLAEGEAAERYVAVPLHVESERCEHWTSATGIELVGLTEGRFKMGAVQPEDRQAARDEQPVREVHLTKSFWMGRFPVTQHQWLSIMKELPVLEPAVARHHTGERKPVARITWDQACKFCELLTQRERQAGALPPGYAYRLPTEAEWEYACRAGTTGPHYDAPLSRIASCPASGRRFTDVGVFAANPWGLHDTLGLVFEWCLDAYAPYRPFETDNPRNMGTPGTPVDRVIRGGCYQGPDSDARASARDAWPAERSSQRLGLRVVLARE